MFVVVLAKRKFRALTDSKNSKVERIGSLLTPIFDYTGWSAFLPDRRKSTDLMDIQYFVKCVILLKDQIYRFFNRSDQAFPCRLA